MRTLKAGIIGLQHLHPISYIPHLLSNNVDLIGVAEPDKNILGIKKGFFPSGVHFYDDYQELIVSNKLDFVVIFSQLDLGPEIVQFIAKNKVNIIIEKPIASSLAGANSIIKSCNENNIIASVPYVWRYHSASREIKRIIDTGLLGKIQAIEGRCIAGRIDRYISANSGWILEKKKAGGGSMWNLGVHWIDLFRWFLGFDKVDRVYAEYSNFTPDIEIEENSSAIIKFKSGVVSTLNIGYSSPPSFPYGRDLHINIRGTLGSITWNPAFEGAEDEIFICSDHPDFFGAPNRILKLNQRRCDGYSGMMGFQYIAEFVECVMKNKKPFITLEDGLDILKITDALNRSADSKNVIRFN